MTSEHIEKFDWSNEHIAKGEYDRFMNQLETLLGNKSVMFVLQESRVKDEFPKLPAPLGPSATPQEAQQHEKLTILQTSKLHDFRSKCDTAIGILKGCFNYGCKALQDLQTICKVPQTVDIPDPNNPSNSIKFAYNAANWTSDHKIVACLKHLRDNYSPKDSTDVNQLRRQLSELNDSEGFYVYVQEFTRILGILESAGQRPDKDTLREWVKAAIDNPVVRTHMCEKYFPLDAPAKEIEEIFKGISHFLKIMGDKHDPYKTARSPIKTLTSSALLSNVNPSSPTSSDSDLCTRCWGSGHNWRNCNEPICYACNKKIEGYRICPSASKHDDPRMRFVPKTLRNKRGNELLFDSASNDAKKQSATTTQQDLKKAQDKVKKYQRIASALLVECNKKNQQDLPSSDDDDE
jgi:hypothetical protein